MISDEDCTLFALCSLNYVSKLACKEHKIMCISFFNVPSGKMCYYFLVFLTPSFLTMKLGWMCQLPIITTKVSRNHRCRCLDHICTQIHIYLPTWYLQHICTCTHTHTHKHTHLHTLCHKSTYTHLHMHTHAHVCTRARTHKHTPQT